MLCCDAVQTVDKREWEYCGQWDTATSTEQRSDLGRLQEWHPLRMCSQCVHDWPCVCVCRQRNLKDKRAHRRGKQRKRYKVKMLTSPLLINWVIHWVVKQWKFLIKSASKRQAERSGWMVVAVVERWLDTPKSSGDRNYAPFKFNSFSLLEVKKKVTTEVHHSRCQGLSRPPTH